MNVGDTILNLVVVGGFGVWAYSKFKKQSIGETFEEIKELLGIIKNG